MTVDFVAQIDKDSFVISILEKDESFDYRFKSF